MRKRVRVYGRRVPAVTWGLILFAALACWSLYSAGEQGMYAPLPAKAVSYTHLKKVPVERGAILRWLRAPC